MSAIPKLKDYEIKECIGFGSTSVVYLAHKKKDFTKMVAIKVMDRSKLCKQMEEGIIAEIELMVKLKHKHIVQMIDFICEEKNIIMILEHCDGGDLSMFIKKQSKLSENLCRRFMQQLALALQYLRSQNVCHLDLKPQNLFLMKSPQLTLKVGDFGLARIMHDDTQMTSARGSPLYMAPEMIIYNEYDIKADLWSVGVIAYECLHGTAPYASHSLSVLRNKVWNFSPIDLSFINVSSQCRDFLSGLLKHNPSERINYDAYFGHAFLDLEHMPTQESYAKGLEALQLAVQLDLDQNYKAAFYKYCTGLQYLIPHASNMSNSIKFVEKLNEYCNRAAELKAKFCTSKEKENDKDANNALLASSVLETPSQDIGNICQDSPQFSTALEIIVFGQMYYIEGQYQAAVEKFEIGLKLIKNFLENEPKGPRYNLIVQKMAIWTEQYENATKELASNKNEQKNNDGPVDVSDGMALLTVSNTRRSSLISNFLRRLTRISFRRNRPS